MYSTQQTDVQISETNLRRSRSLTLKIHFSSIRFYQFTLLYYFISNDHINTTCKGDLSVSAIKINIIYANVVVIEVIFVKLCLINSVYVFHSILSCVIHLIIYYFAIDRLTSYAINGK